MEDFYFESIPIGPDNMHSAQNIETGFCHNDVHVQSSTSTRFSFDENKFSNKIGVRITSITRFLHFSRFLFSRKALVRVKEENLKTIVQNLCNFRNWNLKGKCLLITFNN